MLTGLNKKIGQSTIECATLVAVIAIALAVMAGYLRRAIGAKLENVRQDFNESIK